MVLPLKYESKRKGTPLKKLELLDTIQDSVSIHSHRCIYEMIYRSSPVYIGVASLADSDVGEIEVKFCWHPRKQE